MIEIGPNLKDLIDGVLVIVMFIVGFLLVARAFK